MTKLAVHRAKVSDVRNWVEALGVLCSDNMTPTEAEMKVLAYVPMLQADFPPAAFCQDSLSHVSRECKYFPAYAEVYTHLSAWWRKHRSLPPALPPPDLPPPRPEPTEEERAYVRACVQEIVGNMRSPFSERDDARPRTAHFSPGLLDQLNPLPNGHKRIAALLK